MKRWFVVAFVLSGLLVGGRGICQAMRFTHVETLTETAFETIYGTTEMSLEGDSALLEATGKDGAALGCYELIPPDGLPAFVPGNWRRFLPKGLTAMIRVKTAEGNVRVGVRTRMGEVGEIAVYYEVWLEQWEGKHTIRYGAAGYLPGGGRVPMTTGVFGNWEGGWVAGAPVQLAVVWLGDEAWGYASGHELVPQFLSLVPIEVSEPEVEIFVWADRGEDNRILAAVSQVFGIIP